MFNFRRFASRLCWHSCRIFNGSESDGPYLLVYVVDTNGLATLLATQIGFGGTLGFLLGYGLKKVATIVLKILALVSGLFMLGMTWLASLGIITVNFDAFYKNTGATFAGALAGLIGSLTFMAQILPIGGSFGLGFYLGAKKG
jgi:uncharacterized membrane protein (Fun14 family)